MNRGESVNFEEFANRGGSANFEEFGNCGGFPQGHPQAQAESRCPQGLHRLLQPSPQRYYCPCQELQYAGAAGAAARAAGAWQPR